MIESSYYGLQALDILKSSLSELPSWKLIWVLNYLGCVKFKFEALKIMIENGCNDKLNSVTKDIYATFRESFECMLEDESITFSESLSDDMKIRRFNIEYARNIHDERKISILVIVGSIELENSILPVINSSTTRVNTSEVVNNVTVESNIVESNIISKDKEKDDRVIKGLPSKEEAKKQYIGELNDIHDDTPEDKKCIVCWETLRTYLLLPCKHLCLCSSCLLSVTSKEEKLCPFCREEINEVIRVIFP
jgi:hypothetical protein